MDNKTKKQESRLSARHVALIIIPLFGALLAVSPYPSALNNLEARIAFTSQFVGHILGLREDYDVDGLNHLYEKSAEPARILATTALNGRRVRPFQLSPLPELDAETDPQWREKFRELFVNGEKPVVVRKLAYADKETFPMAKDWNIEFLKDKVYRNMKVPVFTNTSFDKSAIMMPFLDYVESLKDKTKTRYARCLDDVNKTMSKGFSLDNVVDLMDKRWENELSHFLNGDYGVCLFVGSSHVSTRMHYDVATSAFVMIEGRKRWTMFPQSETMYFLPIGHMYNVAYNSRVDIFAEDLLDKYPFAALAKGWEVVIEPGDVLFFPSFTWHGVENLDDLTVGMDIAVHDAISSLRRNFIPAAGTIFNLKVWAKVIMSKLQGKVGSLKSIFFEGYLQDDARDEAAIDGQYA